jgi:pSer/pThr/pTyr-binding forkhead associated (FHA) protein
LSWNDRRFPLDDASMTIGRDPDCAIWIDVPGVSRRHAAITRDPRTGSFSIDDLGSTNGTFVAGKRVRAPVTLVDGQPLHIGEAMLTFRAPTPVDAPTKRIKRR